VKEKEREQNLMISVLKIVLKTLFKPFYHGGWLLARSSIKFLNKFNKPIVV
jgi:hypothetical protein